MVWPLVKNHPVIDQSIFFDTTTKPSFSQWYQLFKSIRKNKYDLAIISNPHKFFHLICFLAGIPKRIGHQRKWSFLLTNSLPVSPFQKHEIDKNLDLVCLICSPPSLPSKIHLPVSDESRTKMHLFLNKHKRPDQKVIVVNPLTTNPQKEWPLHRMKELVKKLSQGNNLILLIGNPSEEKKISTLLEGISQDNIINTCSLFLLEDLPALFEKTDLLISNDSGPVHIASAFAVGMVVLYGMADPGSNPHRWGPRGLKTHRLIIRTTTKDITEDDVWKEIQIQLKS